MSSTNNIFPIKAIISTTRAWLPFLLRPRMTLKSLVDCFSLYDPSAWKASLELLDSGLKLGMDILLPALLLSLVASFLPSSRLGGTDAVGGLPSYTNVFSPYTPHSLALSSLPPHATSDAVVDYSLFSNFDPNYLVRCIVLSMFSPITIDILFRNFAPVTSTLLSRLQTVLSSHKGPDISTKLFLSERVQLGRAIRRHAYDLYFPPKVSDAIKLNCIQSLLFFPGFGIDRSAYADVSSRISDEGIPVAVVSLEPFRLAHKSLGGGMNDVRRLIQLAGQDIVQQHYKHHVHKDKFGSETKSDERRRSIIIEWAIGGHSMGGYNALQLAEVLQSNDGKPPSVLLHDGSLSRIGRKIVAWAAGTDVNLFPDLSHAGSSLQLEVLILLASKDSIARILSHQQKRRILSRLPKKSRLGTIKGGNHSGFASYESQTSPFDGLREISLESQHEATSFQTTSFLLNK